MKASTELRDHAGVFNNCSRLEQSEALHSTVTSTLQRACRSIGYCGSVAVAVFSDEDAVGYQLHQQEQCLLHPQARAKRRSTWTRGRAAAHAALKQLQINEISPITRGAAGEPLWPAGISGSITHCNGYSIAATIQSSGDLFLGIDLEDLRRIKGFDIASFVCSPNEMRWIRDGNDFRERLGSIFSAKEALYKALFPAFRRYVDFREVELSQSAGDPGCFAAMSSLEGRICQDISVIHTQRYHDLIFSCSIYRATR